MKNQRVQSIVRVGGNKEAWPSFFVITDGGIYEYTWHAFEKRIDHPNGSVVPLPTTVSNKLIEQVRGDGEFSVILLESQDAIIFEIAHKLFCNKVISWHAMRVELAADFQKWREEFEGMSLLPIL